MTPTDRLVAFLPRRSKYSKAKQDSDEEKHLHQGKDGTPAMLWFITLKTLAASSGAFMSAIRKPRMQLSPGIKSKNKLRRS